MKKLLLTVLAVSLMVGIAYADLVDNVVSYIRERPLKAGLSYDFDGKDALTSIGTTVANVSKFDIDLLVSGEGLDLFNDNNIIVSSGLSYGLPITTNTKVSIGASLGLKRFESFKNSETGEGKILASILLKYKF